MAIQIEMFSHNKAVKSHLQMNLFDIIRFHQVIGNSVQSKW